MWIIDDFIKNKVFIFALIFTLITRAFIVINSIYFLFPVILFFVIISEYKYLINSLKDYKIIIYALFPIWLFISSLWSQIPLTSFLRSLYFSEILIGMYFLSKNLDYSSLKWSIIIISLFMVFLNIISLIFRVPNDYWNGGNGQGFMGFFSHQNMLGSILFLFLSIMIFIAHKLFFDEIKLIRFLLLALLLISMLFFLILSFSRGAIISFIIFGLSYVLLNFGMKRTFVLLIIIILFVFSLTKIDKINDSLKYIIYKKSEHILDTREVMYKTSIDAAYKGGLFGIGYGVSDQKFKINVPGNMKEGKFVREKGSTFLALIEETGIIGMVLFYLPLFHGFKRYFVNYSAKSKKGNNENRENINTKIEASFLISIILAMFLHSQIEAWGVGVGSVLLPFYLLFLIRLNNITMA